MSTVAERPSSLPQRSAGGVFWVMLEGGLAQVLALITFAVIARFINPHAYGLVAVSLAMLEMLRAILVDVLATVLTSDRLAKLKDWHGAYWVTIAWCTALTLLAAALSPLVAWAIHASDLTPVLQLLSLNIIIYGFGRIPEGYLTQQMRFRPLALRTLASVIVGGACGVAAAIAGWGVYALIVQQLLMAAVSSALVIWLARWRPSFSISPRRLRRHIHHAVKLTPSALAYVVSQNLDVIIVTSMLGASMSGLYNLARRLRLSAQMMFLGVGRVALAAFTSLNAAPERIGPAFVRGAQALAIISMPAFVGLALVGEEFVSLIFGPRWTAAAPILAILMLAGPVLGFNDYLEQLLISRRKLGSLALAKVLYIAALTALLIVSVHFGWVGVAWASTLSVALLTPIMLQAARQTINIDMSALARAMAAPILASATMAAVILFVRPFLPFHSQALRLLCLLALGALIYGVTLRLLARQAVDALLSMGLRMAPALPAPFPSPPGYIALRAQAAALSAQVQTIGRKARAPAREAFHFARRNMISPLLPKAPVRPSPRGPEIAVCGLLSSSAGLGKSARLCAHELGQLGYTVYADDISEDYALNDGVLGADLPRPPAGFSGVKIWHLNPPMLLPTMLRHAPHRFFDSYNIGYWAWEFDTMPRDWLQTARMMDAIMVTSNFVADALRPHISVPLFVVHHPLDVTPAFSRVDWRRRLGIASNDFVVHLNYNYGSAFERKNPLAAMEAFFRAFPDDKGAKLVIKTAQSQAHAADHQRVIDAISSQERVHIVDAVLPDHDMQGLIGCSDALISMHRSEGFGLPMAEAMYLGVPVVATRWSGNLDFCKEETSYLVRAHLTPVKVRHAHLSGLKNATWSEPDAAHAAAHLRAIYEHPEEASAKARAARAEILALQQTYSYQNALQALAEGRTS